MSASFSVAMAHTQARSAPRWAPVYAYANAHGLLATFASAVRVKGMLFER